MLCGEGAYLTARENMPFFFLISANNSKYESISHGGSLGSSYYATCESFFGLQVNHYLQYSKNNIRFEYLSASPEAMNSLLEK